MKLWDELVGQDCAVDQLKSAAVAAHDSDSASSRMSHAWLIVGPPGSGRSNLAYAFAGALLAGKDADNDAKLVAARTHPDLVSLSTDGVLISIDEVRKLVANSYYAPSVSKYRVIVIEDADRMAERTSNVLLKALEEPPDSTVWILCAPSEADLLPTIKSRVRTVRLQHPSIKNVAALLVARNGIDAALAKSAARKAQSHVGMALRLATSENASNRRDQSVRLCLQITGAASAVWVAGQLYKIAEEDAKELAGQQNEEELAQLYRSLGLEPGQTVPPGLRVQVREKEEAQKRRASRGLRDALDRILLDLIGLYRDVISLQLQTQEPLINLEYSGEITQLAQKTSSEQTVKSITALSDARIRLTSNAAPLLLLEAAMVQCGQASR